MSVPLQTALDKIYSWLGRCVVKSHLDGETIGFTSEQAVDRSLSVLKTKGTLTLGGTPFDGHEDVALPAVLVRPDPAQLGEYMTFFFPPGYIWESLSPANPHEYLGYGVWEPFAQGRMTVGVDPDDPDFNESGLPGGEKAHQLTHEETPKRMATHIHGAYNESVAGRSVGVSFIRDSTSTYGQQYAVTSGNAQCDRYTWGGDKPHNNMPPYITVYRFVRVDGL